MYMYMYIVNVLHVCMHKKCYYNKINVHVHVYNVYLHVHVYTVHVIFNFLFSR